MSEKEKTLISIKLNMTPAEKEELRIAANRVSMPLAVYIRASALAAARREAAEHRPPARD